ncbi:NAD+ synthase [Deferribacterales bacterium RsTz2092]|nr:NH(3)-dependent NAD(+) synthetase [Deferribacterales bacterium]GHU85582.1 NH(3)-dependent NAD(+) synthetase [Deferribacterales bacterium]
MVTIDSTRLDKIIADFAMLIADTGLKNAVIGLSGGIDSALACNLAIKAIGCEHVFTYNMPSATSSQASYEDSALVAKHLGVAFETISIAGIAQAYPNFDLLSAHRKGNICARLRMLMLFDKAVEHDALVIGTGNKSEAMLGYCTWYGDSACSINPLADMYKSQVYQAAKLLGIPEKIINKAPSADLYVGQTDEEDFGYTYKELDRLLDELVENGKSPEEAINAGFDRAFVESVAERMNKYAFKRFLPKCISIDQK